MRKNRNKMLSSVETYINQEYTETIEKNLKKGDLYVGFQDYSEALDEMITNFRHHFKLAKDDDGSPYIRMLKTQLFYKIVKAGKILEHSSK